jgi:eukaryotic-like serine/threonine-protein kinase
MRELYEFGGFRLDPLRRVLFGTDGEPVALKSKVFDTLLYLVEHAGEPLEKSAMIAAIWPNLVVEEGNLNKNISVLRRALGEAPDEHRFIVTEPGRGYRFVAKVNVLLQDESAAALLAAAPRAAEPARARRPYSFGVTPLIAAGGTVALVVAVNLASREAPEPRPDVRFEIETPTAMNPLNIALSPDGRQIVFSGEAESGTSLWIRSLDALEARVLPQTTGADLAFPFWSADGKQIVFRSGTELKRIQVADGSTETIVDGITRFRRGAWSTEGTVLFTTDVIHRLSAPGSEPIPLTTLDRSLGEAAHAAPSFLPNQRHFLYKAATWNRRDGTIYIGSIDAREPRRKLLEASRAIYVEPGYVLFAREEKLFARAFDADRLAFTGEPVLIADDVLYSDSLDTSAFDASNDGTLIMRRRRPAGPDLPLVWTDRSGSTRTPVDLKLSPIDFRLSPEGKRIVYSEGDPPDVWVLDIERGSRARLTADAEADHNAVWSPDGEWIAFDSHRDGRRGIYRKRADGAVPEELLYDAGPYEIHVTDWSDDGRFIVFHQDNMCLGCNYDIWVLPTFGEPKPIRYTAGSFEELYGALSPDGRWLAYTTNESGTYQVVVQPFPDPSRGKWQISADGGTIVRWTRGGSELYYIDVSGSIVRVPIEAEPVFDVGEPVRVGDAQGLQRWDVLPDGERLLKMEPELPLVSTAEHPYDFPITVILNWPALIANR